MTANRPVSWVPPMLAFRPDFAVKVERDRVVMPEFLEVWLGESIP
ncbi:MAG: hypothetical protein ACYDHB_10385 [Candidatus Dormibacteria bacterium]